MSSQSLSNHSRRKSTLWLCFVAMLAVASVVLFVSPAWLARGLTAPVPDPTWTLCANEGGQCNFSGTRQVRYGTNGTFFTGTFTNNVTCTSANFGGDPGGVNKHCDFSGTPDSGVTITVTSAADSGPNTLRQAVLDAGEGDTIQIAIPTPSPSPNTSPTPPPITLTSGEIPINKSLTIKGPGASVQTLQRDSGAVGFRIFNVGNGSASIPNVTVSGLTISGGKAVNSAAGCILSTNAVLTINDSVLSNNHSDSDAGAIESTSTQGNTTVTIKRSTFSGNSSNDKGGAVYFGFSSAAISDSTFIGNSADTGGAVTAGGVIGVTISNCTFSGNSARLGGGIHGNNGAALSINNSTLSGNKATAQGGGINTRFLNGFCSLNSSVVANNTSDNGNSGPDSGPDIFWVINAGDYNLIKSTNGLFQLPGSHNITGQDPLLGPLQDNGGPTKTFALMAGSPGIDQGINLNSFANDQRGLGFARTVDDGSIGNAAGGDGTDIGAFEVQSGSPSPTPTPTPTPTPLVCPTGFADCDGVAANGCEVNLTNDNNNCAHCGNVCPSGTHCSGSGCVANPTPTPTPSATPFAATLTFDGRLRDRVSRNDNGAGLVADGDPDGTFTLTLPPATSAKFISKIVLSGPNGDVWDTIPNNGIWTIGTARSLDGPFENTTDGHLDNVPVGNTGVFKLFTAAAVPNVFTQGSGFTATVTFGDNTTAAGSVTLSQTAAVDLSIVNLSTNPTPSATERQNITYQVHVVNHGTELATGVTLTHQFVSYEVYDSGGVSNNSGSAGTCTPDNAKVVCTAINLGPGEDATFAIIAYFRKASDPNAGHAAFTVSSIQTDANATDNSGQITVSLGTLPRPGNDDIANAVTIIGDKGTTGGNNFGATRQSDLNLCAVTACIGIQNPHQAEPIHAGQFGDSSIWYKWIGPSDGPVDFFTTTSKFNTLLAVYTFENGFFTAVVSNDDASPSVTWSKVHFDAVGNKTYYIAIDGFLGAAGDLSLGWSHSPVTPATNPAAVTAICAGNKPNCDPLKNPADTAAVCTSDSDSGILCTQYQDAGGFTMITLRGTNFTSNSQVIIRGDILKGFDNNGNPINGATDFINSTTLVAHVPPNPPLKIEDLASTQVITFLSSATAAAARDTATLESIPAGTYSLAANTALLNVIQLKNATIPEGKSQQVCGNVPGLNKLGEETCMLITNLVGPGDRTVTPTWFQIHAYCKKEGLNLQQCAGYGEGQEGLNQLMHNAFAINPQQPIQNGSITVKQQFPIPTGADLIHLGALIVAQGAGNIVATGAGNIVAAGAGNIVATGAGNIVATGAGNIVATGAGNIVAQGAGNIVATGAGNIVATGAGNFTRPDDLFVQPTAAPPVLTAADLQNGSRGWFATSSSGGNAPTVTVTTNRDGTMTGTLTMTFDQTSNPRIQDLQGLLFTVVSNPAVVKLASNNITVNEGDGRATVTLTRTGDTTTTVTVSYATSPGTATEKTDFMPVYGAVTFNPGETQKTVNIPLIDNGYGPGLGVSRSFNLTIGNVVGGAIQMPNMATITINNNDNADAALNPAEDTRFFVRQHYLDFLGREPDQSGWDFWTNDVESCGTDANCRQLRRIDVSAAFFLSIEFQNTGFLVHRLYNAALNRPNQMPRYIEFIRDTQEMATGLVVNQTGWEAQLEANKQAFLADFVTRPEFLGLYPVTLSPADYVAALYAHAGITPSAAERQAALDEFNNPDGGARGRVLRRIAESNVLTSRETNRAFVLAQYFGYLRRNPDDAPDGNLDGFNFWLTKLNNFGGDFRKAEMVKAFIVSGEYRKRFGPN